MPNKSYSMTEHIVNTENVVASSTTGCEIDLDAVREDLEKDSETSVKYNPEEFPGLVCRIKDSEISTLIFSSGRIVGTGAKSTNSAIEGVNSVIERLSSLGINVSGREEPIIQNIVNSSDLGNRLNLNAVAIGLGVVNVEYEPEQFPGLIYRIDNPDVCLLLFGSGKVVISGSKREGEAQEAVEKVNSELERLNLI